jgi:DNA-binding transcriptional LysR family regulator
LYDPIAVFGISDNNSSMELRHLRYFSAVAEYLNYSEASRRLHVAQAAISQTILDLEQELEARLFLRTKRRVQLTAAGSIFLKEAEEILRRADQATRLVRRAARGEVGTLRIGFLGPATSEFLPALIQDYRSKYPDVQLRLEHMTPDEQLAAFDEGRIDVGLSRSLPLERRSSFNESTLYTDYLIVALPGAHPLAKERAIKLEKLAGEPFVLFNRLGAPSAFDQVIATCRRAGFSPHVVLEPSSLATVITLVESGLGVSLVPGCARSLSQKTVAFRPLANRSKPIPLCVAWPRATDSPIVEAFLETLRSQGLAIKKQMEKIMPCHE